jgi:hypothetical protein
MSWHTASLRELGPSTTPMDLRASSCSSPLMGGSGGWSSRAGAMRSRSRLGSTRIPSPTVTGQQPRVAAKARRHRSPPIARSGLTYALVAAPLQADRRSARRQRYLRLIPIPTLALFFFAVLRPRQLSRPPAALPGSISPGDEIPQQQIRSCEHTMITVRSDHGTAASAAVRLTTRRPQLCPSCSVVARVWPANQAGDHLRRWEVRPRMAY